MWKIAHQKRGMQSFRSVAIPLPWDRHGRCVKCIAQGARKVTTAVPHFIRLLRYTKTITVLAPPHNCSVHDSPQGWQRAKPCASVWAGSQCYFGNSADNQDSVCLSNWTGPGTLMNHTALHNRMFSMQKLIFSSGHFFARKNNSSVRSTCF